MKDRMKRESKQLAFLLRHDATYEFEPGGWRRVDDLIESHGFSCAVIDNIVATDSKGRYEMSPDKTLIRARWGHSVSVELGDECVSVPDTLYHGTADIYLLSIQKKGIERKNRQFVHLTDDRILAMKTGKRHGNPVVLTIDAKKMKEDGVKFWKRGDCIWLTKKVDIQYISIRVETTGKSNMEMDYNAKWATIMTCIHNASEQYVEQAEMPAFLKRVFDTAIHTLGELVEAGIDLGDKDVVSRLQELILAICQIPQHRIHAFDVSTVLKEFEEYEEHFYGYLSLPKQDAENSFTCDWLVDRLADFAKNPPDGEEYGEKLTLYMDLCGNLMRSGSNKIRVYLADALEKLAQSCTYVAPDGLYRFLAYYVGEQNAENSVCCDFVVRKINYLAEHPNDVNSEVLDSYLDICEKLAENGSDKIRAYLVRATENLAHILTSEWMQDEAKKMWELVVKLLSQDNMRIIQRENRLENAKETLKNM